MLSKKVNSAASWSILATAVAFCIYSAQLLRIVSDTVALDDTISVSQKSTTAALNNSF